jgi:hypothetical protein
MRRGLNRCFVARILLLALALGADLLCSCVGRWIECKWQANSQRGIHNAASRSLSSAHFKAFILGRLSRLLAGGAGGKTRGTAPRGYVAEPRVHLGSFFEIDVCTFENGERPEPPLGSGPNGGVAIATYEVLVYDAERDRKLVAAVEIVSPANKDRPESRQMFVAKCAALLQKGVCTSIVDLVTIRRANLYAELLKLIEGSDPAVTTDPPSLYAVTCRKHVVHPKTRLETWSHPLVLGQPLPQLPVWLTEHKAVQLDLEASYEQTCRVLRIP